MTNKTTEFSDNVFVRLSQVPRYHQLIPFPCKLEDGSTFEVAMVVLNPEEILTVLYEAEKQTRARLKGVVKPEEEKSSIAYKDIFADLKTINTLFLSLRHPRDLTKFALPSREWLTNSPHMTADKINILHEQYLTAMYKQPEIKDMGKEELDQWIKDVIRDGTEPSFLVDFFSVRGLKDLTVTLLSQLAKLQTPISSSGTLPENTPKTPPTTMA